MCIFMCKYVCGGGRVGALASLVSSWKAGRGAAPQEMHGDSNCVAGKLMSLLASCRT
jgi:hypothetical protein